MLACRTAGQGAAVVLIHGVTLHSACSKELVALASWYRVIAPDMPGHGESPPLAPGEDPFTANMAQKVLALLDRLGIGRAAVAGHSMGGYVALALYRLVPERVAGLCLRSTTVAADVPERRALRLEEARRVLAEGSGPVLEFRAPRRFAPSVAPGSPLWEQGLALMRKATIQGIHDALLAMAGRPDLTALVPGIAVALLIVTGDQDMAVPPERSREMAAAHPAAELVVLPGLGHMPMLEAPGAVAEAIARWLARVYPGAGSGRGEAAAGQRESAPGHREAPGPEEAAPAHREAPGQEGAAPALVTPLGLSPGLLFSAVRLIRPEQVVIVTSRQGAELAPGALAQAGYEGPWHMVEMADPHAGFAEVPRVLDEVRWHVAGRRPGAPVVVNYTGGTTAIQYAVGRVAEDLQAAGHPVRRVAIVDRRPPEVQRADPYRVGEVVDLP